MKKVESISGRREIVGGMALGALAFMTPGAFAEQLTRTARQAEGPFYPDKLPLDTDNDLIILNDSTKPSVGQIAHLSGRVLTPAGNPIRNAVVEIWQCDAKGVYLHSGSAGKKNQDKHFQGFGRFLTNRKGEYYFRTIRPVPYPGRTPHIHLIVRKGDKRLLTTQIYVKGEKRNERDGLLRRVRDKKARESLLAEFKPLKGSKIKELEAEFNIVIGRTPND